MRSHGAAVVPVSAGNILNILLSSYDRSTDILRRHGKWIQRSACLHMRHFQAGWVHWFEEVELRTVSEWSRKIKSRTLFLWKYLNLLQSDGQIL